MAVDMFLKIAGIDGESIDGSHGKEIDINSWNWGMSQSGTNHVANGGGAGKVSVNDINITKFVDKASANLIDACCTGKHFDSALLTIRKAGLKPLEYLTIELKNVIITNISVGGSGGDDRITESVTLNFAEFKYNYKPQRADGSAEGTITKGFNMAKNQPV